MIGFSGCNQSSFDQYIKAEYDQYIEAEKAGLIQDVHEEIIINKYKFKVSKVYNDVTGYIIFYNHNTKEKYQVRFELEDDLGNEYKPVIKRMASKSIIEGFINIDNIHPKANSIDMQVVIYENLRNKDGYYIEKEIESQIINLPLVYPESYYDSIDIRKEYNVSVGKNHVILKRISLGKSISLFEYTSYPNYISIDKIIVDYQNFTTVASSGKSNNEGMYDCIGSISFVNNPRTIKIEFIDKETGTKGDIVIDVSGGSE